MRVMLDIGVLGLTILIMVFIGMEVEVADLRSVWRSRGQLAATLLTQTLVLPVIALVLVRALELPVHVSAGLLLLAACPLGNIVNFYTLLGRGNLAWSVVMNAMSCLLAFATMSFAFGIYARFLGTAFVFALPAPHSFLWLGLLVAIPVLGGMWLRRVRPDFVGRHLKHLSHICLGGAVLLLVYVLVSQHEQLAREWRQTVLSAALFLCLALLSGWAFSKALRLAAGDRFTVTVSFAVRNVGLATAIAVTLLNRIEYAAFATVYFVLQVPLLLALVAAYRHSSSRFQFSLTPAPKPK